MSNSLGPVKSPSKHVMEDVPPLYATPQVDFTKPIDPSILSGQTALVTGGAGGMGIAIASAMAEAGAHVVIVDTDAENGDAEAKKLQDKGYHVKFVSADVTSYDSQLAAFKAAISFSPHSTLDIVCPFAGIQGSAFARDALPDALADDADPPPPFTKCIDVNLYGVLYSAHLAAHYFKKAQAQRVAARRPRPQLLLMSSIAGYGDQHGIGNYASSKWGVRGLFRALRGVPEQLGLCRTNLLAPFFVRTATTELEAEELVAKHRLKVGEVADATEAALRCLCDEKIEGRAVVIAPGEMNGGKPGSANFDICDDLVGFDGGKGFYDAYRKRIFGDGYADVGRYSKRSREGSSAVDYRQGQGAQWRA